MTIRFSSRPSILNISFMAKHKPCGTYFKQLSQIWLARHKLKKKKKKKKTRPRDLTGERVIKLKSFRKKIVS